MAGSNDCSVVLFDLERGEKINTYYNKKYGVDLVRFTHHNKCILCASTRDSEFRVMYWSLHDNNILCSFIGHTDAITHLDLNPKDATFLSVSKDGTTRVWDYLKMDECLVKINKSKAACFDNSGLIMACVFVRQGGSSMALEQFVHLFRTENFKDKPFNTFTIDFEQRPILNIKFSPNGAYILLATSSTSFMLLDAFKGTMISKFEGAS